MVYNISSITASTYDIIKDAYDEGIRDFQFEIDSVGGSLDAAFRIYDLLRGDATCVVKANVSGECYSAATVILLSAPLENRTATEHSTFMIHSPLLPVMQDVNKTAVDQIKDTIDAAYIQLKNIYTDRTSLNMLVDEYMNAERVFYADEAMRAGFISAKKDLYNLDNNKKMSRIRNLVNSIISQLKNEKYVTVDNVEFEALAIEVGVPVEGLQDGVYELSTGEVITVDSGIIIDIVPKQEEVVETVEPEAVKNEDVVEEPVEPAAPESVEPAVDNLEEQITEAVKEAVEELRQELEAKYKNLAELVNSVGGTQRLVALKNATPEKKNFKSETKTNAKRSLDDLMQLVK